ncbi:hypothetical protein [Luteimonas granuli]|uniref:Uncharacterized protein n=1 Tax=Luteimonas granuli TaxID=1176533 RepID=A0A518N3I6_9GAMM|nr:hypothetical protein [Luteimonas granuli]QDW66479.1 hypothetical protein FPZ22_05860 [Luteimonas granuli]
MPAARPLDPAQAQRFLAAQARLQEGDGAAALRLARALVTEAPQAADRAAAAGDVPGRCR